MLFGKIFHMLSKKDEKILELLRKNAKLSSKHISEQTGIPITTVHNRVKKLEKSGIIKGYRAIVDSRKTGRSIHAFVQVELNYKHDASAMKRIAAMPEVEEWYLVTGVTDAILRVSASDVEELNDFLVHRLKNVKGVEKTLTSLVLKEA